MKVKLKANVKMEVRDKADDGGEREVEIIIILEILVVMRKKPKLMPPRMITLRIVMRLRLPNLVNPLQFHA